MKKFGTLVLVLLFSLCFILTGCSAPLKMPTNYENVTSNGGFVVNVGNYLYFANGYKSYSSLKTASDNSGSGVGANSLSFTKK